MSKSITKTAPTGTNINATTPPDPSAAWGNPGAVGGPDGVYATNNFGGTISPYPVTKWLYATNFDFFAAGDQNVLSDFPSNGTTTGNISGIQIQVIRHQSSGTTQSAVDYEVGLITNQHGGIPLLGSPTFLSAYVKIGDSTAWPIVDQPKTYGGSSDLWGRNWTPAELNDPSFGFGILVANEVAGNLNNSISNITAFVDSIQVTVYYDAPIVVTSTGGCICGGSAPVSSTYNVTSTSGVLVSGDYPNRFTMPSTSGTVLGSTAPLAMTHIVIASGGIVIGSSATIQETMKITAAGGVVLNGNHFSIFPITSTGGIVIGSSFGLNIGYNQVSSGGIVCGSNTIVAITPFTSGGLIIGGTAQPILIIYGKGGCIIGGSAATLFTYNIAALGGSIIGATSGVLATYLVAALGGSIIGGKFIVGINEPSTGGMLIGGKFIVGISSPSKGGSVAGGSAIVALWIFGHGGAVLNGTSVVRGIYSIKARAGVVVGGNQTVPEYLQFFQSSQTGYCRAMAGENICKPVAVPPLTRFIKDVAPPLDPNRFQFNAGSPWCDISIKQCGTTTFLPKIIVVRQNGYVPPGVTA